MARAWCARGAGELVGAIDRGLPVLVGVDKRDDAASVERRFQRPSGMR